MRWRIGLLLSAALTLPAVVYGENLRPLTLQPTSVEIGTDFTGGRLAAAGELGREGALIIKVEGPPQDLRLSRKDKWGPIWMVDENISFKNVPSLLFIYASEPLESMLTPEARARYGLQAEGAHLRIEPQPQKQAEAQWRSALSRLRTKAGLYREDEGAIKLSADRKFSLDIRLPADLQTGRYRVEALSVADGAVRDRAVSEFEVRFVGVESWLWAVAHAHSWLFGSLFTLCAILLGLGLAAIFPRRR